MINNQNAYKRDPRGPLWAVLFSAAVWALIAAVVMSCTGCVTVEQVEREIERVKRRTDVPVERLPDETTNDKGNGENGTDSGSHVENKPYPWIGKNVHVDHATCDEDVTAWAETAVMPFADVAGSTIRWAYLQGEGPGWSANPRGGMGWAQSNMMLMARRGDRWETWYGHWLRYDQYRQDFAQMFYERGREWPDHGFDEVWVCIAAPNRHKLQTTRERSNWLRVK